MHMTDRQKTTEHVISMLAKFEGKLGEPNVRQKLLTMSDERVLSLITRLEAMPDEKAAAAARELRTFIGFRKDTTVE